MWPFNKTGRGGGGSASLGGQIANFGDLEETLGAALAAYRGALDGVASHTPRILKDQAADLKRNLRQIRARLESEPSAGLLRDAAKDVDRELANWGRAAEAGFEAQEREAKDAMAAVAVMAEALGGHEKTYGVRFRGISKKLRLLTTSSDISEIRRKLQGEIELLEQYVDQMTQESESALGRLRDLDNERRSRAAAAAATPDGGAGAGAGETEAGGDDRRRLTDAIRAQVKADDRVAIVRLSGPEAAAAKGAALIVARMRDVFESSALTGRWSGESFVSITRLPLPEAAARLEIVERDLSTKLGARLEGTVFEKTPGTTAAELLGRFESKPKAAA